MLLGYVFPENGVCCGKKEINIHTGRKGLKKGRKITKSCINKFLYCKQQTHVLLDKKAETLMEFYSKQTQSCVKTKKTRGSI